MQEVYHLYMPTIKPFGFHGPRPSSSCASNRLLKNSLALNSFSGIPMRYAQKEFHAPTARPCYNGTKSSHALADVLTRITPFGSLVTDTGAENVSILNRRS